MPWALAGLGMAGSLIGGLFGSSGAKSAGTTIGKTGTAVGQSINQATGGAINAGYAGLTQANNSLAQGQNSLNNYGSQQTGLFFNTNSGLLPYQSAGYQGLNGLSTMGSNYQPFQFDTSNLMNDKGLQFQMQQGNQALESQAAAKGMLQSGANEKAVMNYSQGLASTYENQAYQQQLGQYQTNFGNQLGLNQAMSNIGLQGSGLVNQLALGYGSQIGQQMGLSTGLNSQGANLAMQGNQYIGNVGLQGAGMAGGMYMQGAEGTAAGQVGSANAWSGAIGGMTNSLMGGIGLSSLGPTPNYGLYGGLASAGSVAQTGG